MIRTNVSRFASWLLVVVCGSAGLRGTPTAEVRLTASTEADARTLTISATLPAETERVIIRVASDRNRTISSIRDVSPLNPDPADQLAWDGEHDRNIWYPVVDFALPRGAVGVARFAGDALERGYAVVNGPFFRDPRPLASELVVAGGEMLAWENSVMVSPRHVRMTAFAVQWEVPVVAGRAIAQLALASEHWAGDVTLIDRAGLELATARVEAVASVAEKDVETPAGLTAGRLHEGLRDAADFTLRSRVRDPHHPARGGLFLFYDLDASTYRSPHWVWGWGPSVKLLLELAKRENDAERRAEFERAARDIGDAALRFVWHDPGSDLDGMMISRWDRELRFPDGYAGAITPADALFFAGWAWVPLYEATGDPRYLVAARRQAEVTTKLMDDWVVPPHSYFLRRRAWDNWVIDEVGFGVEGYAELWRATGDDAMRDGGRLFVNRHRGLFEDDDGLWHRMYLFDTGAYKPSHRMTRGLGWVMEGLLAAHRLDPEGDHLEAARRMADILLAHQRPDGAWTWAFDRPEAEVGISEKGTALWSWLLYRLHAETGERRYLDAARRALLWCLDASYRGADPEARGSIVGCSPQSGVGYRRWYRVACTYTMAFAGLAMLEELERRESKQ